MNKNLVDEFKKLAEDLYNDDKDKFYEVYDKMEEMINNKKQIKGDFKNEK